MQMYELNIIIYSKACVKRPLSKRYKIGFQMQLSLNAGQKYCRMLQESILQYFRPSLSYHLSLRPLFCPFLSGCFTQVLLYMIFVMHIHDPQCCLNVFTYLSLAAVT